MSSSKAQEAIRSEARERRIAATTIAVLRDDAGPYRRVCAVCAAGVVSICYRGLDSGELLRCENGHDCTRFVVEKRRRQCRVARG
jgi:hypothetical protein